MKILSLSDVENKGLWDFYEKGRLSDVDLIISCGDLDPGYLEFIESVTNVPLYSAMTAVLRSAYIPFLRYRPQSRSL